MSETSQAKINAVIFGAGEAGCAAYELLRNEFNILAFVDNDASKYDSDVLGLKVISANDIKASGAQKVLIASEYSEQIFAQLSALKLEQKIEVLASRYLKTIEFSHTEIREQATQVLVTLCATLNNTNIRYYVDAGTLLGIVRDGDLIPWDDDLDIALHAPDVSLFESQLPTLLDAIKTTFGEQYTAHTYMTKSGFGAVPAGAIRSFKLVPINPKSTMSMIDIFVKYIDGNDMDYCLASRGIRMPSIHFNSFDDFVFKQQHIKLPHQHEAYLLAHYGDWQTPKPDWSLSELDNSTLF